MKRIFILSLAVLASIQANAQDLSAIFEKVSPAVVQIQTKEKEIIGKGQMKQTVTRGTVNGTDREFTNEE